MIKITIEGTITIDDATAEVLNHLCSYGFAEHFYEKASHRFSVEEIKQRMSRLRQETSIILEARQKAVDVLRS